jgi:hypothetical protein
MDKIEDIYYYSTESKTFLKWKTDRYGGWYNRQLLYCKDTDAGSYGVVDPRGYPVCGRIYLNKKPIIISRCIWEMFHGPIPEKMVIDHLDGNPWNNNINNLACKTQQQNLHNMLQRKDNRSGLKGVTFTCKGKYEYVTASYYDNETQIQKHFSITKFGKEKALEMAKEWKILKINELNLAGSMYTERHYLQGD